VDNVPLGRLAPWVFGLAIGSKPVKKKGNSGTMNASDSCNSSSIPLIPFH